MSARTFVITMAFVATWSIAGRTQGTFPPTRLLNLQVLPPSSGPREVIGTMRDLTRALGVRCQFCHVGAEGQPLDTFDFASDAPAKKQTARAMMRLVASINDQLGANTPGSATTRVTCYTCHRGAERPVHSPDAPKPGP